MALITNALRGELRNELTGRLDEVVLYSTAPTESSPGTEISGTRQTVAWSSGAATAVFDVESGTTVAGAGFYSASNDYLAGTVLPEQPFNSGGTYTLTISATIN